MSCTRLFVGRDRTRCLYSLLGVVLVGLIPAAVLRAAPPRVLPAGAQPADVRLGPLRDLDGYFPFTVAPSREHWQTRAAEVRQQLLVALGLWPEPARTPLNPVIHSPREIGRASCRERV